MWIQEGWTTYLEGLYVEHRWGKADGLKYLNGYKPKVLNRQPIVPLAASMPVRRWISISARPIHQHFRTIVDDDKRWSRCARFLRSVQVSCQHD